LSSVLIEQVQIPFLFLDITLQYIIDKLDVNLVLLRKTSHTVRSRFSVWISFPWGDFSVIDPNRYSLRFTKYTFTPIAFREVALYSEGTVAE